MIVVVRLATAAVEDVLDLRVHLTGGQGERSTCPVGVCRRVGLEGHGQGAKVGRAQHRSQRAVAVGDPGRPAGLEVLPLLRLHLRELVDDRDLLLDVAVQPPGGRHDLLARRRVRCRGLDEEQVRAGLCGPQLGEGGLEGARVLRHLLEVPGRTPQRDAAGPADDAERDAQDEQRRGDLDRDGAVHEPAALERRGRCLRAHQPISASV